MTEAQRSDDGHREVLERLRTALTAVIRGKAEAVDLMLVAVLAGGHVLIEDVPGVGKTTLAKALSRALGLDLARVQFTPDLLPADILGASVLDPQRGTLRFQPGPIFTHVLLADEINRASPRTQSALLEAMNEGQVTTDGATRPLPVPFFVLATQNPADYQGTYPLPEAQLDRFLLRVELGYPGEDDEVAVLFARQTTDPLDDVPPLLDAPRLLALQAAVRDVTVSPDVGRYVVRLARHTRASPDLALGVSPRGALALFRAAQAHAFLRGRSWVGPADVQAVALPVLAHRLMPTPQARYAGRGAVQAVEAALQGTPVPT